MHLVHELSRCGVFAGTGPCERGVQFSAHGEGGVLLLSAASPPNGPSSLMVALVRDGVNRAEKWR